MFLSGPRVPNNILLRSDCLLPGQMGALRHLYLHRKSCFNIRYASGGQLSVKAAAAGDGGAPTWAPAPWKRATALYDSGVFFTRARVHTIESSRARLISVGL